MGAEHAVVSLPLAAIVADVVALAAFLVVKGGSDPLIIVLSTAGVAGIFLFEGVYLRVRGPADQRATSP